MQSIFGIQANEMSKIEHQLKCAYIREPFNAKLGYMFFVVVFFLHLLHDLMKTP